MPGQLPQHVDAASQISTQQNQMLLQSQEHSEQYQPQLLNAIPHQNFQIPHQSQRGIVPNYAFGILCAKRLKDYIHSQNHRPQDNNIDFWRVFVAEFFAPNAKKKLCFSNYESVRQTNWVYTWNCEICDHQLGHGFEACYEVLPVIFKAKFESGISKEHIYLDMPHEYYSSSGHIALYYDKARKEGILEDFCVVHDGYLRVVFASNMKICAWEFCAKGHEVFMRKNSLTPRFNQFVAVAENYIALARSNGTNNVSCEEVGNIFDLLVVSTDHLAKALNDQLVNELGYPKSYVRRLQVSQVVNSMKDLIGYSTKHGISPLESLIRFAKGPFVY